jgi:uncharacterized protein
LPQYYTVAKIGKTRELTPEGYLLLRDVAVARTGSMVYHPSEINRPGLPPIHSNRPDGLVSVTRSEDDVFRPETLQSLIGKAFTNDHPGSGEDGVNPENWRRLTNGVVLSARRGIGEDSDLTLADVIVFCPGQIKLIHDGKEEVSCGYDCDYFQTDDGQVFQRNIIYNHLALVEAGRCGERCAIGDSKPGDEIAMKTSDKKTWFDALKVFIAGGKTVEAKKMLDEMPPDMMSEGDEAPNGVAVHVHPPATGVVGDARKWDDKALDEKFGALEKMSNDNHKSVMDSLEELKKGLPAKAMDDEEKRKEIEGELKEEAPAGSGEDSAKAKDSAFLSESFSATVSLAEIIAPGIHLPTYDRAASPVKTFESICGLRRKALAFANNDAKTNSLIVKANGGREMTADSITKLPCGSLRTLFYAVGGLKKDENSKTTQRSAVDSRTNAGSTVPTLTELNKKNHEFWNARKKTVA